MGNSQSAEMLTALNDAALAIAEGLSLPRTLQRIADTARALVKTKYAALGVFHEDSLELKQFITSGVDRSTVRGVHHDPEGKGLLGAIVLEGKPIRLEKMQDDPRSTGFCEGHPMMTSFLGVPIKNKSKSLGNLYLSDRLDGQPFDDQDEELLTLMAAHAALAIENARLHNELQAAALRSERDRIGMELHDGVIQAIYAVGMQVEILQSRLTLTPEQQAQCSMIVRNLNKIIDDIRSYIRNLISAHDEQTTLRQKVENLVAHFRDFSGISVTVDIHDGLPVLTDYHRHNLMQILRESLANIARHSGATEATITIRPEGNEIWMVIEDNGKGFDLERTDSDSNHFGLRNIEERARRLGGHINIAPQKGKGTTITLILNSAV